VLTAHGQSLVSALTGGYHLAFTVAAVVVAVGVPVAFFVLRPVVSRPVRRGLSPEAEPGDQAIELEAALEAIEV
jgi:hypothetical protein